MFALQARRQQEPSRTSRCSPRRLASRAGGTTGASSRCGTGVAADTSRRYRIIDFRRDKVGIPARKVETIEYDPNRSANIALIFVTGTGSGGTSSPRHGLQRRGHRDHLGIPRSGYSSPGNALPLKAIPLGTQLHNIEMRPGKGGQIVSLRRRLGAVAGQARAATPSCGFRPARCARCSCRVLRHGRPGRATSTRERQSMGKAGRRNRWLGADPPCAAWR